MIWMAKLLHITTVSIWMAGLMVVPFLLWQRSGLSDEPRHRLHRLVRTLYIHITSPAAFVAIASGTVLIFLQATFVEWFSIKLVLVGMLSGLHVLAGLLILQVFAVEGKIGGARVLSITAATLATMSGVLLLVLWKPQIDALALAPDLFRPGRLAEILAPVTAWVKP
ncbi:MAG: CopD family protein [Pseudorhodobacter sp.]